MPIHLPAARPALRVEPVAGHIGADITGIDLAQPVNPDTADLVRATLRDYKVVFFHGQHIGHAEHIAFARNFGELTRADPHRDTGDDEFPEILTVDPRPDQDRFGRDFERRFRHRRLFHYSSWHIDNSFVVNPPAASILRADTVPTVGGDTQWTNLVAAYDGLSTPLQRLADGLRAEHRFLAGFHMPDHDDEVAPILAMSAATPIVTVHPLVRVIPETGEKALFVSPSTTARIVGLSTVESRTLLDLFCQEITRDEYRVRLRWQPGSVAFWDNRTTAHLAALDHDHLDEPRRLYRVTLLGDTPAGPDGTASTAVAGTALTPPPESAPQPISGTTSGADRT